MSTVDMVTILVLRSGAVSYFSAYRTFIDPQGSAHMRTITFAVSPFIVKACSKPHTARIATAGISMSLMNETR